MKKLSLLAFICIGLACQAPGAKQPSKTDSAISSQDTPQNADITAGSPIAPKQDTASLKGEWLLQPVLPSDTATGKRPTLNFRLSDHSFTGNTGCNNMRGRFESTDTSLVFDEHIVLTKMACTGYDEAAFLKSLLRTNRYRIEDGVLVLLFNNEELSRWTRRNYKAPVKKSI